MRVVQLGDVGGQGLRVAGDVEDALEAPGQLAGVRVHAGAWRVDEDAAEVVALQVDARQAAERAHLVEGLGQFLGGQTHQLDVVHAVVGQVGQGGIHRGLADLGGQYLAHAGGQRQGEVAVAAVQLEQVILALAERIVGPAEHLLADPAIGLGEGTFRLAVVEAAPGHVELLGHVVAADHQALATRATDQADVERARQFFRLGLPGVVQRTVIGQGYQGVAGQGGEELHLEQFERQHLAGLPGRAQAWHQLVHAQAGDGEVVEQDRRVLVARGEHGVVALTVFTPQAELGAHAVMLARRVEYHRLGCGEGRQQFDQTGLLLGELGFVGGGVECGAAHRSLVQAGKRGAIVAEPVAACLGLLVGAALWVGASERLVDMKSDVHPRWWPAGA